MFLCNVFLLIDLKTRKALNPYFTSVTTCVAPNTKYILQLQCLHHQASNYSRQLLSHIGWKWKERLSKIWKDIENKNLNSLKISLLRSESLKVLRITYWNNKCCTCGFLIILKNIQKSFGFLLKVLRLNKNCSEVIRNCLEFQTFYAAGHFLICYVVPRSNW